jgi:hypothetical protein
MRIAVLSAVSLINLTACVGTMDSLHSVEGLAPDDGSCRVVISEAGTSRVVRSEHVRGKFSVSYSAGGPFPPRVDIAGVCNGKAVKQLKAVAPRTIGVADLGTLAP